MPFLIDRSKMVLTQWINPDWLWGGPTIKTFYFWLGMTENLCTCSRGWCRYVLQKTWGAPSYKMPTGSGCKMWCCHIANKYHDELTNHHGALWASALLCWNSLCNPQAQCKQAIWMIVALQQVEKGKLGVIFALFSIGWVLKCFLHLISNCFICTFLCRFGQ